jgi:hypothetical protein
VTGEDKKKHEERIAASKTVIIENLALDLGLSAKDIQKFLLDKLQEMGEQNIKIVDVDMNYGPSSVSVELQDRSMVDQLKKLNGLNCLGS